MTVQIYVMDGPLRMADKDVRRNSESVHKAHLVNKNNITSGCILPLPEDILFQDP